MRKISFVIVVAQAGLMGCAPSNAGTNVGSGGSGGGGETATATGGSVVAGSGGAETGGIGSGGNVTDASVDFAREAGNGVTDAAHGIDRPGAAGAAGTGTGGAAGAGQSGGGSTGTEGDRCDVGVYDPASPPKALTLSGNLGVHDPSSAIDSAGVYYLYATGLVAKTSTNLTSWQGAGAPVGIAAWATTAVPGVTNLWAPDISYFGGQYHLYYAASTFGSNRSCIGHATRTALTTGSWVDQGSATLCSNVGTKDSWNAIDPNVIVDPAGTPWLVFGSWFSGIQVVQLSATGTRSTTDSTVYPIASRSSGIEGPFMVRRCGYYYLFTSWDLCCKGASSTYNIRVGRSTKITGGFVDKAGLALTSGGGTLIAKTGGDWAGPGGQSLTFVGKKAYLVYHAYAMSDGASFLRIADLVWDSDGWPIPVGP